MRYYQVEIADPTSGAIQRTFTSYPNGKTDPGALDMEMDIPVFNFASPGGSSFVRLWGIGLNDIAQASNFNPAGDGSPGKRISVYGGMKKGLPLANSAQSGLLAVGTIVQAFGNWIGTDMTLDLFFSSGDPSPGKPANLAFSWPQGTTLATVIKQTLTQAFPGYTADVNISSSLVLNNDEAGFYGTLTQFAQWVQDISIKINGEPGVDITLNDTTFRVYDPTTNPNPKPIAFNDLIGQVTWRGIYTIQATCVMRYDIRVGDIITLPQGQTTTTAQSYAQYRQKSAFSGNFQVSGVRHVGRFRNPSGEAWVTVIDANVIA